MNLTGQVSHALSKLDLNKVKDTAIAEAERHHERQPTTKETLAESATCIAGYLQFHLGHAKDSGDGFVIVQAPFDGGESVTVEVTYEEEAHSLDADLVVCIPK